jgi:DNA-binding transcriptional regulator YdaS (Cro superfamily)/uncharacterized protein (DUF433 family)
MMDGEVIVISNQADIRFDVPLYTVAEAARALGVHPSTLSTWAKGYVRHSPGRQPVRGEAIVTSLQSDHGQPSIPFVGLAEALVLAGIRKSGVPLQRVRPALAALSSEIGIEHALASRRLFTDGAEILFDHATALSGDEAELVRELVVVRSGQRVFAEIVDQYLKLISYGSDDYASQIRLPAYERAEVIADPLRGFGQPIFAHGAASLNDVLQRFWSGDDIDTLSAEFGVPIPEIEDVLRATSRRAA